MLQTILAFVIGWLVLAGAALFVLFRWAGMIVHMNPCHYCGSTSPPAALAPNPTLWFCDRHCLERHTKFQAALLEALPEELAALAYAASDPDVPDPYVRRTYTPIRVYVAAIAILVMSAFGVHWFANAMADQDTAYPSQVRR